MEFPPLNLQMKVMVPGARPFKKAKPGDAAYDIWAIQSGTIEPGKSVPIETGIATAFDPHWAALIVDRSGVGWKGLLRLAGCIDSNWRDQWRVKLYNTSETPFTFESVLQNPDAKAVAQVLFLPCGNEDPRIMDMLPESVRGVNWQGSSDAPKFSEGQPVKIVGECHWKGQEGTVIGTAKEGAQERRYEVAFGSHTIWFMESELTGGKQ